MANGENGHHSGLAIGAGSDANGRGVTLDDGDTYPGCNIVVDHEFFNRPVR